MITKTDKQRLNGIRKAIENHNNKEDNFKSCPYTLGWIEQLTK